MLIDRFLIVLSNFFINYQISSAMSLLNIIETVELANPEAIFLHIISSFQTISSGIVHKRMCNLLLNGNVISSDSKLVCLKNVQEIVLQSTNRRFLSLAIILFYVS
jgi:hypothetical protein